MSITNWGCVWQDAYVFECVITQFCVACNKELVKSIMMKAVWNNSGQYLHKGVYLFSFVWCTCTICSAYIYECEVEKCECI